MKQRGSLVRSPTGKAFCSRQPGRTQAFAVKLSFTALLELTKAVPTVRFCPPRVARLMVTDWFCVR